MWVQKAKEAGIQEDELCIQKLQGSFVPVGERRDDSVGFQGAVEIAMTNKEAAQQEQGVDDLDGGHNFTRKIPLLQNIQKFDGNPRGASQVAKGQVKRKLEKEQRYDA